MRRSKGFITSPDKYGFQARIKKNGKERSKYFAHSQWGGPEKAAQAARNWLDAQAAALNQLESAEDRPLNNKRSCGVRGVSLATKRDKRRGETRLAWLVSYKKDGRPASKTFDIGRVGEIDADREFQRFREACRFRWEYLSDAGR